MKHGLWMVVRSGIGRPREVIGLYFSERSAKLHAADDKINHRSSDCRTTAEGIIETNDTYLDFLRELQATHPSRDRALAITKLQEMEFWLSQPAPYPPITVKHADPNNPNANADLNR